MSGKRRDTAPFGVSDPSGRSERVSFRTRRAERSGNPVMRGDGRIIEQGWLDARDCLKGFLRHVWPIS